MNNTKDLAERLTELLGTHVASKYLDLFTEAQQKYMYVLSTQSKDYPKLKEVLYSKRHLKRQANPNNPQWLGEKMKQF